MQKDISSIIIIVTAVNAFSGMNSYDHVGKDGGWLKMCQIEDFKRLQLVESLMCNVVA